MTPTPQSLSLPAGEKMSTDDELVKRLNTRCMKRTGETERTCTEAAARIVALTAELDAALRRRDHERRAKEEYAEGCRLRKEQAEVAEARATAAERERDDLKRLLKDLATSGIEAIRSGAGTDERMNFAAECRVALATLTTEPRS
jgi:Skp family chaperone for outer membrane proteins